MALRLVRFWTGVALALMTGVFTFGFLASGGNLASGVTIGAIAQGLPLPGQSLPGQPQPQSPIPDKADCSAAGVTAMQRQLDQLESIEKSGSETIGLFCRVLQHALGFSAERNFDRGRNLLAEDRAAFNILANIFEGKM